MQVHQHSTLRGDALERLPQGPLTLASGGAEDVAVDAVGVHAHQHALAFPQLSPHQCQVEFRVGGGGVGDAAEFAELRGQAALAHPADLPLMAQAEADQLGHRDHLQSMVAAELLELRHAGHGAVVVHDFADHSGREEARQPGQVHGGLGLTGPHQHAAFPGAQREDVARARQIAGPGRGIDGHADGPCAVGRRDARGHPLAGVDGLVECRPQPGGVVRRERVQVQLLAALRGQRQADQAPPVPGHEVDDLGRDLLRRHGEVPFVFAVLVVHHYQHAAGADLFDGLRKRHKGHTLQYPTARWGRRFRRSAQGYSRATAASVTPPANRISITPIRILTATSAPRNSFHANRPHSAPTTAAL